MNKLISLSPPPPLLPPLRMSPNVARFWESPRCTSSCARLVETRPRPPDPELSPPWGLWRVRRWRLAASRMSPPSPRTLPAGREVAVVVVCRNVVCCAVGAYVWDIPWINDGQPMNPLLSLYLSHEIFTPLDYLAGKYITSHSQLVGNLLSSSPLIPTNRIDPTQSMREVAWEWK